MDLIPSLKYVPGLTYLALNWNDLENESQKGLDYLAQFVHSDECELMFLDLRNSNLGHESSKNLERIVSANKLKHIDLSWNNLTDLTADAILRGLMQRGSACALQFKGCSFSDKKASKIREELTNLAMRYEHQAPPTGVADKDVSNLGPDNVLGFKRIELNKIYNPNLTNHLSEIQRKKLADGSRIVLNPHTAELEILMGEMIKKKIQAKDRVLRQLDSLIAENREADNELEHLKTKYL